MNRSIFQLFAFSLLSLSLVLPSCVVPKKKYDEMANQYAGCLNARDSLSADLDRCKLSYQDLERMLGHLKNDTARLGPALRMTASEFADLQEKFASLTKDNEALKQTSDKEIRKILAELDQTRESLQNKEDALNKTEKELAEKKANLDRLMADMQQKEARLNELQGILDSKDKVVQSLRKKVSDALLGFEGQGLTVNVRNGKVYVSLEEKLLFATGKYEVNAEGRQALGKLAQVLAENKDISVLIEGHTDDVPLAGSGVIRDNWDLSVMRATAVVKILTNNKGIDPRRLTAAGRSEYLPLDAAKTKEARAKNRRTEIILTPKLDELFKILETN
jgi:chemotaxis protein MotB